MLDMIIKNSGLIILGIVFSAFVLTASILWSLKKRRVIRKGDFERIWRDLKMGTSHDDILSMFKEGIHIHEHYRLGFPDGCADRWHFYSVAYAAIRERIAFIKNEHDKTIATPRFSDANIKRILKNNLDYHVKDLENQLVELARISQAWPAREVSGVEATT